MYPYVLYTDDVKDGVQLHYNPPPTFRRHGHMKAGEMEAVRLTCPINTQVHHEEHASTKKGTVTTVPQLHLNSGFP